jgi:hypothetical protein
MCFRFIFGYPEIAKFGKEWKRILKATDGAQRLQADRNAPHSPGAGNFESALNISREFNEAEPRKRLIDSWSEGQHLHPTTRFTARP